MIFLVLGITVALLVYLTIITKHKDKGGYLLAFGVLIASVLVFLIIGLIFNELYYSIGNPTIESIEVELHPLREITLEDYISQEKVTVMDYDHNLIEIDLKKVEVIFQKYNNEEELLLQTKRPQGIWKLFVLEQSHSEYVVIISDAWMDSDPEN